MVHSVLPRVFTLAMTKLKVPTNVQELEEAVHALPYFGVADLAHLQHDGLLVQLWLGDDRVEVARSLERLSTAVLGYDQPVAHKAWD